MYVSQEKTDVKPVISPTLEEGRVASLKITASDGAVQVKFCVRDTDAGPKLKFGLVEAVYYEWAKDMVCIRLLPIILCY